MKSNRITSRQTNRSGSYLVELIIVIGMSAVVLATCISLLRLTFSLEHKLQYSTNYLQTVSKVSRIFRDDIHSGKSAIFEDEQQGVEKRNVLEISHSSNKKIRYFSNEHFLLREVLGTDSVIQKEKFAFPESSNITFQIDSNQSLLSLIIRRPMSASGEGGAFSESQFAPQREIRFEAVLDQFQEFDPRRSDSNTRSTKKGDE